MSLSQAFGSSNPFQAPQYGEVVATSAVAKQVANTKITANSVVLIWLKTPVGANAGSCGVTVQDGVGFSLQAPATQVDTSTYYYMILKY
jgi:hypothetical protein